MKPNFALSLSFEGIRLLHRAAGGWRIVGDVALDAQDMAAELAVLRRTATALDPSGMRTKVLLPNAQIKYLTLDTDGLDDTERRAAAATALDGATPYAVADLAFDISIDGPRTHVAAVARETLDEAEEFATEHRFNPISFAAVPGDKPFLGEPYFGPSATAQAALAHGDTIEPDGIAVVIIGDAEDGPNDAPVIAVPDDEPVEPALADDSPEGAKPEITDADASTPDVTEDSDKVEAQAVPASTDAPAQPPADTDVQGDAAETHAEETPKQQSPKETQAGSDADEKADVHTSGQVPPAPVIPVAKAGPTTRDDTATPAQPPAPAAFKSKPIVTPEIVTPDIADSAEKSDAPPADTPKPTPSIKPLSASPSAGFASRRSDAGTVPPTRREPSVVAPTPKTPVVSAPQADTPLPPFTAPAQTPTSEPKSEAPSRASAGLAAASAAAAPIGRFLSRRRANTSGEKTAAAPAGAHAAASRPVPQTEAERMTIFGAREANVGGKPRFLGLVLTAALLVFLAGVAAWASVFLDDGLNLSRLFGDRSDRETAADATTAPEQTQQEEPEGVQTAALDPTLTPEDTAVLDALRDPLPVDPEEARRTLEARYATSGIWAQAPQVPPEPSGLLNLDDLYQPGIDPVSTASDAVALPALASLNTDLVFGTVASPPPAGTQFSLDSEGRVIPSAEGSISPDGFTVYLGRPPATPPATLARFAAVPQDAPATSALAGVRPKTRPDDLAEQNERATLDGNTRSELAGTRPRLRPRSVQEDAAAATIETDAAVEAALTTPPEAAPVPFATATALATTASARPDTRPRNFNRIVRRAQRAVEQQETRVASRQVAPRVVTPRNPTRQSVARAATQRNQLNLRRVNLIGIYGKPSNRRALVRLGNGRYKEVKVGGRVDGGRVSAIGPSELRYRKSGRNLVLRMP